MVKTIVPNKGFSQKLEQNGVGFVIVAIPGYIHLFSPPFCEFILLLLLQIGICYLFCRNLLRFVIVYDHIWA